MEEKEKNDIDFDIDFDFDEFEVIPPKVGDQNMTLEKY